MFKKSLRRCIASLLLCVICIGVFPMAPVHADVTIERQPMVIPTDLPKFNIDKDKWNEVRKSMGYDFNVNETYAEAIRKTMNSALSVPIQLQYVLDTAKTVAGSVVEYIADRMVIDSTLRTTSIDWQEAYSLIAPGTDSKYMYNDAGSAVTHPYALASFSLLTDTATCTGNAANLPIRMLYFSSLIAMGSNPRDSSIISYDGDGRALYDGVPIDCQIYDYMYLSTLANVTDSADSKSWKIQAYNKMAELWTSGDFNEVFKGAGNKDTYMNHWMDVTEAPEFINMLPSFYPTQAQIDIIEEPKYGIAACIVEYVCYCEALRDIGSGQVRQYMANSLQLVKKIYGKSFPVIEKAYDYYGVDNYCTSTNCTYKDIAEVIFGSSGQFTDGASTFQSNQNSPLSVFYAINGSKSFTNIDREAILKGELVNPYRQVTLQSWIDLANDDGNRGQNEQIKQETLGELINNSLKVWYTEHWDNEAKDNANYGIIEASSSYVATSTKSVTLSPEIMQGMAFSTGYIPMQTNIYSADIVDAWRQYNNGDYLEFYFKYGFQRKALYIDQSSSAAVNYFNSGDRATGSSRLCTLRDLIESDGKDVVLYLDGSYYNADDAINIANNKLASHAEDIKTLSDYFSNYLALVELTRDVGDNTNVIFIDKWNWETNKEYVRIALEKADAWVAEHAEDDSTAGSYAGLLDEIEDSLPAIIVPQYVKTNDWIGALAHFIYGWAREIQDEQMQSVFDNAYDSYNVSTFRIPEEVFASEFARGNIHLLLDEYAKLLTEIYGGDVSVWKMTGSIRKELALRQAAEALNPDNELDASFLAADGGAYPSNPLLKDKTVALYSGFKVPVDDRQRDLADNMDTVFYSSTMIDDTLNRRQSSTYYSQNADGTVAETTYTQLASYSADLGVSYISAMYRTPTYIDLAGQVKSNNPVFIASEKLCGLEDEGLTQWHKNSLLNYAMLQNLEANATINYEYVTDLDSPIYMDIFGNILTESGTVIIPAACNATLFTGDFNQQNIAAGLYYVYGKSYSVPLTVEGAYEVMLPFFFPDEVTYCYEISPISLTTSSGTTVDYRKMSTIGGSTKNALIKLFYLSVTADLTNASELEPIEEKAVRGLPDWRTKTITPYIKSTYETKVNWVAMVNVINEVMRGAPVEYIDKGQEGLNTVIRNKAAIIAGIKLENLIESLQGNFVNSLLALPDFTKMDNIDYLIALLVKLTVIATCGIAIVLVYRDAVSYKLGYMTLFRVGAAIALSTACIVTVPAVFQITYYGANKLILEDEAFKILMLNTEKAAMGTELTMTDQQEYSTDNNFSIQLDTFSLPWYESLESIVFDSVNDSMTAAYKKAVATSPIYAAPDVVVENDGVYVTTEMLFNSTTVYYDFGHDSPTPYSLHFKANNSNQTPGFYLPYYVFLDTLVRRINAYNMNQLVTDSGVTNEGGITFTTKYLRGHELSTVGICKSYFTSPYFMEGGSDILGISAIYAGGSVGDSIAESFKYATYELGYYSTEDLEAMKNCMWYNDLIESKLADRINAMDTILRDFVVENKSLLDKCSDETFLEVTALYMAIKYNQLFGIPYANALEIDNLDSSDLIRLCIVGYDEAMLSSPLSYSRFVMEFGGAPAIYMAAILTIIMWIGSFIKPLCTVIVFVSVFMSIWVFRVILRKPSANLLGYFVTMGLLCLTNFAHALILKLSLLLPVWGLPPLGCLIFIIVGQVAYLMVLAYVTGVALKDWYNLGASEYEKEARMLKAKFKADSNDRLNGNVAHHENNWDYYDDLVKQHRARNKT